MKSIFEFNDQFKQIIKGITRPESNTRIDIILTICEKVKECGSHNIGIGDHLPVYFNRKRLNQLNKIQLFRGRT